MKFGLCRVKWGRMITKVQANLVRNTWIRFCLLYPIFLVAYRLFANYENVFVIDGAVVFYGVLAVGGWIASFATGRATKSRAAPSQEPILPRPVISRQPDHQKFEHFVPLQPASLSKLSLPNERDQIKATIWSQSHPDKLPADLFEMRIDEDGLFIQIRKTEDIDNLVETVFKSSTRVFLFRLNLPSISLFCQLLLGQRRAASVYFRSTGKIYKIERRAHVRVPIEIRPRIQIAFTLEPTAVRKIEFKAQVSSLLMAPIMDLSQGGLAIYLDEKSKQKIEVGAKLYNGIFEVASRKIKFVGEVKHIRKLRHQLGGLQYKAGILFTEISNEDRNFIAQYVNEESMRYLGRLN